MTIRKIRVLLDGSLHLTAILRRTFVWYSHGHLAVALASMAILTLVKFAEHADAVEYSLTAIPISADSGDYFLGDVNDLGQVVGRLGANENHIYWDSQSGLETIVPASEGEVVGISNDGTVYGNLDREVTLNETQCDVNFPDFCLSDSRQVTIYEGFEWTPGSSGPLSPLYPDVGIGSNGSLEDPTQIVGFRQTIEESEPDNNGMFIVTREEIVRALEYVSGETLTPPNGDSPSLIRNVSSGQELWRIEDVGSILRDKLGGITNIGDIVASTDSDVDPADVIVSWLSEDGRVVGQYPQPVTGTTEWFAWDPQNGLSVVPPSTQRINSGGWAWSLSSNRLWKEGETFDVNSLLDSSGAGYTITSITDVNTSGQILAVAETDAFNTYPVLLTPLAAEFSWANPSGGLFGVAANWSPMQRPGSSSTARITQAGTYTVTLNENAEVERLVIGGATSFVNPTLDLNGHVQDSDQLLVDTNASLVVKGSTPGSLVRTDFMNVAPGSNLSGDFWVKPRTGTTATFENEGFQFLGPNSADLAVRTHFIRQGTGPEPDAFDAHVVVRGDYEQLSTGTLRANLSSAKAVNQGRDSTFTHVVQTATDLRVSGKVKLDGNLNLGFETGYVPQHGDSFSIIKGDDVTGTLTVSSPPAFNGLPLRAVVTSKGVQAVVPQKVVLAFGHTLPYAWETVVAFDRRLPFRAPIGPQTTPAYTITPGQMPAFTTYLQTLLQRVQQHYTASGIEGVVFSLGDPQEDAINLYFIDPMNAPYTNFLGEAYTGIDRFNLKAEGEAAIAVRSFNPVNPLAVETDAETIIHEVGHLLGLRHVDPAGATAIMDYDDVRGDFELFVNTVSRIREPPESFGRLFPDMHNPVYHLKRYVDGVPHEDLVAMDILPGHWDLPGPIFEEIDASFRLRLSDSTSGGGSIETLYDVIVYSSMGAPGENLTALARFDEITIAELAEQSFRISSGAGLGMVASSIIGGAHDVLLSLGSPFEEGALAIYPGYGELEAFLQMEADNPAGFLTLADVTVAVAIVPEPGAMVLISLGLFGLLRFRFGYPRGTWRSGSSLHR